MTDISSCASYAPENRALSATEARVFAALADTGRHIDELALTVGLPVGEMLATLLGLGAIPVINENDTVATDEIRFGDNDRLGARVAEMISADTPSRFWSAMRL